MGTFYHKTSRENLDSTAESLFDLKAIDIDGVEQNLSDLAQNYKCIMIVNVATL